LPKISGKSLYKYLHPEFVTFPESTGRLSHDVLLLQGIAHQPKDQENLCLVLGKELTLSPKSGKFCQSTETMEATPERRPVPDVTPLCSTF